MDYRIPERSLPDDDPTPPTEPKGALAPPPRLPPTAVGAAAAGPEPRPPRPVRSWSTPPERPRARPLLFRAVKTTLDVLDGIADTLSTVGKLVAGRIMPRRRPN
jgi:hypothetical protein